MIAFKLNDPVGAWLIGIIFGLIVLMWGASYVLTLLLLA